jgi:hypothetical protein
VENYICAILGWGSIVASIVYTLWLAVRGFRHHLKVIADKQDQRGFDVLPPKDPPA